MPLDKHQRVYRVESIRSNLVVHSRTSLVITPLRVKSELLHMSGSSRVINLFHVLSLHHSSMASIRSHKVSSSRPYISYFPPSKERPSRFASSIAALFSPLKPTILKHNMVGEEVEQQLTATTPVALVGQERRAAPRARQALRGMPETGTRRLPAVSRPICVHKRRRGGDQGTTV